MIYLAIACLYLGAYACNVPFADDSHLVSLGAPPPEWQNKQSVSPSGFQRMLTFSSFQQALATALRGCIAWMGGAQQVRAAVAAVVWGGHDDCCLCLCCHLRASRRHAYVLYYVLRVHTWL